VKKVNTMKAPFKQVWLIKLIAIGLHGNYRLQFQRENIEMFLKGCIAYGLKSQDLFQVNDLYEHKNIYMASIY